MNSIKDEMFDPREHMDGGIVDQIFQHSAQGKFDYMDSLISNLKVVFNVVLVLFDEEPIVDNDPFLSSKSNCRVNPAPIIRTLKIETYGMRATRQPVAAFSSRKLKVRFLPPEIDSIS